MKSLIKFKFNLLWFVFLFTIFSTACDKNDLTDDEQTYELSGYVQKGPFSIGSQVMVYELGQDFVPTGRTFRTSIAALGRFELSSVSLISPYVELVADGFYYNENQGKLSSERIMLNAIVDLSGQSEVNINLLTHLEYERVKFLISVESMTFDDAKIQAQVELMTLFGFSEVLINHAEGLDIMKNSDADATLLAISCILQGNQSTSEMSLLLAELIDDLKNDGVVDQQSIISRIAGQAATINSSKVIGNLITYYQENGADSAEVPDFEPYLVQFVANNPSTDFPFKFPKSTGNGLNILHPDFKVAEKMGVENFHAMAIEMPAEGSVRLEYELIHGNGIMYIAPMSGSGWNYSEFDNGKRTFESTTAGRVIDMAVFFENYGLARLSLYFNGSSTPSIVKEITWGGYNDSDFYFQSESPTGPNLLNYRDSTVIESDQVYIIGLSKDEYFKVSFLVKYSEGVNMTFATGWGGYAYEMKDHEISVVIFQGDNFYNEAAFLISGKGTIHITSDLLFRDGSTLERFLYVE